MTSFRPWRDIGMKSLALLVAAGIWTVVSADRRERVVERAFDVPLALVGIPRNLVITTPLPESVSVRLRGKLSALRALSSQNLESTLDLSASREGEVTVAITPHSINTPPAVEVVSIDPAKLVLRMEGRRQKIVPVRPFLVGSLPPAYVLGDVTVMPPSALVSGPASLIRDVSEVATERIILTGRVESFRVRAGVVADYSLLRVIEPVNVVVEILIEPQAPPVTTDPAGGEGTASETATDTTAAAAAETPE